MRRSSARGRVAVPAPGYPVPERGALFAGREIVEAPLLAERGFLPDLDALPVEDLALLWLNYPNNPTAATVTLDFLERAARARTRTRLRARVRRGVQRDLLRVRATGLGARARRPHERRRVQHPEQALVDARVPQRLRSGRPADHRGAQALSPERRRRASGVRAARRRCRLARRGARRRRPRGLPGQARRVLPAFEAIGMRNAGGDASFFLWLALPDGETSSEAFAAGLLDRGVLVAPGAFFGAAGEGYVRVALVPTLDECRRAARATGRRVARRSGRPRSLNAGARGPRRWCCRGERGDSARRRARAP